MGCQSSNRGRALTVHGRSKLTVFGRRLLVERIELEGWPIAHAAEMAGVSRQPATKWVHRYREAGLDGLEDRSSRPRHSPPAPPAGPPSWPPRRPPGGPCPPPPAPPASAPATGPRACRSATSASGRGN